MEVMLIGRSPAPLESYEIHSHPKWEILLNLTGIGKTYVEDKVYDFKPGTIMYLPPYARHSKTAYGTFTDIYILADSFHFPTNNADIIFEDKEGRIETLMLLAHEIFSERDKNYLAAVDAITESIYQILLGWHDTNKEDENIELFKRILSVKFSNPQFNISEALNQISYCHDYFRRRFKADTGLSPVAYLNNLKIENAKRLLAQKEVTGMNISEIALASGFYDARYFSRMFKSRTGRTPQQYAAEPITFDD